MDWLFQCNPKRYDLAARLQSGIQTESWAVNQHRNDVSPSDRVFLWQTGAEACLLAAAHVTSPVYEAKNEFGLFHVDIEFDYKITPPLTKQEILDNPILRAFSPFKGVMGTNFIIRDPTVAGEIEKAIAGRMVLLSLDSTSSEDLQSSQQTLDQAIKRAERDTIQKLREHIAQMEPFAFEWLVRALLLKLGYSNVKVTKQSGDGGIDVTAVFTAGGITNVHTCIQVKRQPTVGRPTIQNLRGSLRVHESGLVVTSGNFSTQAIEEAIDARKAPITLIDGTRLANLLLTHEIGVKHTKVTLSQLKLADLSKEKLEAIVEAAGSDEPTQIG